MAELFLEYHKILWKMKKITRTFFWRPSLTKVEKFLSNLTGTFYLRKHTSRLTPKSHVVPGLEFNYKIKIN